MSHHGGGGETLPPINQANIGQPNGYGSRSLPIPGRPPTRESFMHPSPSYGSNITHGGPYYSPTSKLPPISSIHNQGSHNTFTHHLPAIDHRDSSGSSSRYSSYRDQSARRPVSSRSKRGYNSNVTSANSSSDEADEGNRRKWGLVAPLEVLRGLADEAVKRASRVSHWFSPPPFICCYLTQQTSHSRDRGLRTPSLRLNPIMA